jgi:hypothetical protein
VPVLEASRTSSTSSKDQKQTPSTSAAQSAEEIDNLQNDLDLQRLLSESHLLDPTSGSPTLAHANRHKAIDMRIQSLGGKFSVFAQPKMCPARYNGMVAKARQRESSRRREARENGIVLEKESKVKTGREGRTARRERGIGAPTIGRFKGGTLKLSKRDLFGMKSQSRR